MLSPLKKPTSEPQEKCRLYYIPLDKIRPNPYQPRKHFDPAALTELSESIRLHGLMQPVTVRKIGGGYELVAGERRTRAARLAGLIEVPALVVEASENQSAVLALIENLQRQDLRFLEEAESYYHLIHEHGFTQEELAERIGKSQSAVANKLRILRLSPLVKKIIEDNYLTERHARALLKLGDEQTQLKLLKTICRKKLNVKQTEEEVDRLLKKELEPREREEQNERARLIHVRDMRIFKNTVQKAVAYIQKAGVNATCTEKEKKDYVEYTIRIPKQA